MWAEREHSVLVPEFVRPFSSGTRPPTGLNPPSDPLAVGNQDFLDSFSRREAEEELTAPPTCTHSHSESFWDDEDEDGGAVTDCGMD